MVNITTIYQSGRAMLHCMMRAMIVSIWNSVVDLPKSDGLICISEVVMKIAARPKIINASLATIIITIHAGGFRLNDGERKMHK